MTQETAKNTASVVTAATLAIVGLVFAGVGVLYIAGMFGLSSAFATQIVNAVEVGGWALAVVMAALSGGTAGLVIATARTAIARWGKQAAIA